MHNLTHMGFPLKFIITMAFPGHFKYNKRAFHGCGRLRSLSLFRGVYFLFTSNRQFSCLFAPNKARDEYLFCNSLHFYSNIWEQFP